MLTPQLIEKMNQLKAALEANPEFMQNLKNTGHETVQNESEHPLIAFAQQNGITLSAQDFTVFFTAVNADNQELDDTHLEMIAGGAGFFEFWKKEWWKENLPDTMLMLATGTW